MAEAASSVDALVADDMDKMAPPFDQYSSASHVHGHPEPTQSYASASDRVSGHGHPSPQMNVRGPPPGFEVKPVAISERPTPTVPPVAASKTEVIPKRPTLAEEEFPALASPKVTKVDSSVSAPPKMAMPNTAIQGKHAAGKKPEVSQRTNDSRRGSLEHDNELAEKEKEVAKNVSATPRSGPRTIRVMTPAKIESPTLMSPVASRIMSIGQRPETPASETVSDSASIVSASVSASRAGSPPPSRIGSAPVRTTTKSSVRKQRKGAMKQETKAIAEAAITDQADHAPIEGRKKKQKKVQHVKEKPAKEKLAAVAAPEAEAPKNEEPKVISRDSKPASAQEGRSSESKPPVGNKPGKVLERTELVPAPQTLASKTQDSVPEEDEPIVPPQTPASVFKDIYQNLWQSTVGKLSLTKPAPGLSAYSNGQKSACAPSVPCKESGCQHCGIQPADVDVLKSGEPVRKQCHKEGSRLLITTYGDTVRNLTEEEEDEFVALQVRVALTADTAGAFTAPRHQTSSGAFSIVKGRAVPNGRPSIFPLSVKPESQDPFGKLQRDEALGYINQYVLPRLNLGASGKVSAAGMAASAAAASSGSLAPLRDAAAASLNSLAPYFYGPEAAAGVGIYSAVDSNSRGAHDFGAPPGLTLGGNVDMVKGTRSMGTIALMDFEEAKRALAVTRDDTEKLEKGLNAVIKRNKRLLIGTD